MNRWRVRTTRETPASQKYVVNHTQAILSQWHNLTVAALAPITSR
jgi:hypothetical protein